jgi:hypothetical protein
VLAKSTRDSCWQLQGRVSRQCGYTKQVNSNTTSSLDYVNIILIRDALAFCDIALAALFYLLLLLHRGNATNDSSTASVHAFGLCMHYPSKESNGGQRRRATAIQEGYLAAKLRRAA